MRILLCLIAFPAFSQSLPFPGPGMPAASSAVCPTGYLHCKLITVSNTMISGGSNLTNYPLTVILPADNDLRVAGSGGFVQNSSGFDIGFFATCTTGSAALFWEMESYTTTTGAIVAHVLITTLNTAGNTLCIAFDGSQSSFQSTASSVWNTGYTAVYHLSDPTAPNDSTATAANGVNHGSTASAGQVDGGAATTGTQYLTAAINLTGTQKLTVEAWFLKASYANDDKLLLEFTANGATNNGGGFGIDPNAAAGNFEVYAASTIGTLDDVTFTVRPSTSVWHHIAVTIDFTLATNEISFIYIDGVSQTLFRPLDANNTGTFANSTLNFMCRNGTGQFTTGSIDEVRISSAIRTGDWILTEYRNQSAPGTYLSVGALQ